MYIFQIGNTWTNIETLSATEMLTQEGFADHQRVKGRNECTHSHAIQRRRGDQGEIPHTGHGQLQRSRYRCGCQREDMHVRLQFLQPLLVLDAKMLFLIDDQQPQIRKMDGLAQQRMGADDDIDLAVGNLLFGESKFLGPDQP